ncbi:hypothetical protein HDU86_001727 [Geranomyces michiganensis]|nr:hypothetical protein HDU86_001727 [Geranomyces michiganensis]
MGRCNRSVPHPPQCDCYPLIGHPHWEKLPTVTIPLTANPPAARKVTAPSGANHANSYLTAAATAATRSKSQPYPYAQYPNSRTGRPAARPPASNRAVPPTLGSRPDEGEATIAGLCDDDRIRLAALVSHLALAQDQKQELQAELDLMKEGLKEMSEQLERTNAEKGDALARNKAITRRLHKAGSLLRQYQAEIEKTKAEVVNLQEGVLLSPDHEPRHALPATGSTPAVLQRPTQRPPHNAEEQRQLHQELRTELNHMNNGLKELREQLERTSVEKSNVLARNKGGNPATLSTLKSSKSSNCIHQVIFRTAITRRLQKAESLLWRYQTEIEKTEAEVSNLQDSVLSSRDHQPQHTLPQSHANRPQNVDESRQLHQELKIELDYMKEGLKAMSEQLERTSVEKSHILARNKAITQRLHKAESLLSDYHSQVEKTKAEVLHLQDASDHDSQRPPLEESMRRHQVDSFDEHRCCSEDRLPATESGQWLPRTDLPVQDRPKGNSSSALPEQRQENLLSAETAQSLQADTVNKLQQEMAKLTSLLSAQVSASGFTDATTTSQTHVDHAVTSSSSLDPPLAKGPDNLKRNPWHSGSESQSNASSAQQLPELADLLRGVLREKSSRHPASAANARAKKRKSQVNEPTRKKDRATSPTPPDSFASSAAAPEPIYHSTREPPAKRYEPLRTHYQSAPTDEHEGWHARSESPVMQPSANRDMRESGSSHRRPTSRSAVHMDPYSQDIPLPAPVRNCPLCPPSNSSISSPGVVPQPPYMRINPQHGPKAGTMLDASLLFPNDTSMIRPLIDILDDLDVTSANARSEGFADGAPRRRSRGTDASVKKVGGSDRGGEVPAWRERGVLDGILDGFSFDNDTSTSATATSAETGSASSAIRDSRRSRRPRWQQKEEEHDNELVDLIRNLNSR